jgi:hypothetical protein
MKLKQRLGVNADHQTGKDNITHFLRHADLRLLINFYKKFFTLSLQADRNIQRRPAGISEGREREYVFFIIFTMSLENALGMA